MKLLRVPVMDSTWINDQQPSDVRGHYAVTCNVCASLRRRGGGRDPGTIVQCCYTPRLSRLYPSQGNVKSQKFTCMTCEWLDNDFRKAPNVQDRCEHARDGQCEVQGKYCTLPTKPDKW